MKTDLKAIKARYGIVGRCEALDRALEIALTVAPTDLTILVLGENGVGKDVISRIVHDNSRRKNKRFMAINCGSIPEGTINSELFGHVKGAFTDATDDREGYFSVCNGGTLFLDEVGELPLTTQALLLRVLEKGEYIPVGSDEVKKTDVRLVAATNMNLPRAIRQGKFREDLYYRLNVVSVNIPPLRERGDDIELLFKKFALDTCEKYNKPDVIRLDPEAAKLLRKYPWPGNIRQLRNLTESLAITAPQQTITPEILRQYLPTQQTDVGEGGLVSSDDQGFESERTVIFTYMAQLTQELRRVEEDLADLRTQLGKPSSHLAKVHTAFQPTASLPSLPAPNGGYTDSSNSHTEEGEYVDAEAEETMEDVKKDVIRDALRRNQGIRKKTAEQLHISERSLYRYIKEYGLEDVK